MAIAGAALSSSPFLGHLPFQLGKSSSPLFTHNSLCIFKVKALFWGSRRSVKPAEKLLSLWEFTLSGPDTLGDAGTSQKISVSAVSPDKGDLCSLDAIGPQRLIPVSHTVFFTT